MILITLMILFEWALLEKLSSFFYSFTGQTLCLYFSWTYMSERSDVYAYFWIEKYHCSSEEISSMMQIAPTKVRKLGDVSQHGKVINRNFWQLDSPLKRGEHFLQDYLSQLLDILEPQKHAIKTLALKYETGISCVGYYYGTNPGLHLSTELIKRLAQLDISVDFDLYNYSEDGAT